MSPEPSVRSVSTPLRVDNKVPFKVPQISWNFPNQLLFLGLEYCKVFFFKSSFESLKMALKFGYSAYPWLVLRDSAKLSWAAVCFCFFNYQQSSRCNRKWRHNLGLNDLTTQWSKFFHLQTEKVYQFCLEAINSMKLWRGQLLPQRWHQSTGWYKCWKSY